MPYYERETKFRNLPYRKRGRKIRVYIAGPITGIPSFNRAAFAEAECTLRNLGYDVFNPTAPGLKYPDYNPEDPRPVHLRRDLVELTKADAVYLLPEYWTTFANIEKYIAIELELPVFYRNGRYFSCWRKRK